MSGDITGKFWLVDHGHIDNVASEMTPQLLTPDPVCVPGRRSSLGERPDANPAESTPRATDVSWKPVAAIALIALGFLFGEAPLLWKFFVDLWQRPQYEFFPLLLAAVPFMAVSSLRDVPAGAVRAGGWGVTLGLWALAWAALVVGAAMYWKWMAPASTLLLGAGVVWSLGGTRLLRALVPVGVMLVLIVPPPGHFDNDLLVRLRQMAVQCSGQLLDALHVPLMLQGAVIAIPGDRLMVEEACSGINSMLAVLAFTVLLTFWKRLPASALLLLLPAAFAYVFWANVLRITSCAFAKQRFGIDLLTGSVHELLGLALFVCCMALVYSTERLGEVLFGWDDQPDEIDAVTTNVAVPGGRRAAWLPWATAAVVFALTGAAVLARTGGAWPLSTLPGAAVFDLPPTLAGWTRVERDASVPERAEVSGKQSHLWQYRRGGQVVTVGLDYPFPGYHDATICYGLAGWTVTGTRERPADASGRRAFEVTMEKAPLAHGRMWFALCDEGGRWWQRPAPVGAESRPATAIRQARERALALPLVQLQVLGVDYAPMTTSQEDAVTALFAAAGDAVAAQLRARPWEAGR